MLCPEPSGKLHFSDALRLFEDNRPEISQRRMKAAVFVGTGDVNANTSMQRPD
jgi:hypothetical protein